MKEIPKQTTSPINIMNTPPSINNKGKRISKKTTPPAIWNSFTRYSKEDIHHYNDNKENDEEQYERISKRRKKEKPQPRVEPQEYH